MNHSPLELAVAHVLVEELPAHFAAPDDYTVPVEAHLDTHALEIMIQIKGRTKNIAYLDIDDTIEIWPLYQEKGVSHNMAPTYQRNGARPYARVEFADPDMVSRVAAPIRELLAVFIADFRAKWPHLDPHQWQHGGGKPPKG